MVPSFQDAFGDALATALEKVQPVPKGVCTMCVCVHVRSLIRRNPS